MIHMLVRADRKCQHSPIKPIMSGNTKITKNQEMAASFFSQAELSPEAKKNSKDDQLKRQAEKVFQTQKVKLERGT